MLQAFLSLLDLDYSAGFSCPCCPPDPKDWTIIMDGTTLGFKRSLMQRRQPAAPSNEQRGSVAP